MVRTRSSLMFVAVTLTFTLIVTRAEVGRPSADVDVVIDEWEVPAGSFPHDPAVAPDGAVWYTGQRSHTLGRLDPETGVITEYPLRQGSGPHGLVADQAGNIWYTGNAASHVGKLDPTTGEVTEYPMPDPRARDPHTPIFDDSEILWFTVQNGNFIGRLDPTTGEVVLRESSTPNSRPYGIVIDAGSPVFDLFGTNKIGIIDPTTLEIAEWTLPAGARPRRIAVTPDYMIWYTDFARGFLGRLDPFTSEVTEFPSPRGAASQPYGIASTPDGIVWYTETGPGQPNTVVRFDPETSGMQSWPIPSGGGTVRHMVAAPNGDVWLACSGVDRMARVRVVKTP